MISRLEEENSEMLRELQMLEQRQVDIGDDTTGQLNNLRERTSELESRMREKQQQVPIRYQQANEYNFFREGN